MNFSVPHSGDHNGRSDSMHDSFFDLPEVTVWLQQAADGDTDAEAQAFHLVQKRLLRIADALFRRERPGHTLEPACLVTDVFREFVAKPDQPFKNRLEFLQLAAYRMRQLLIDYAKRRLTQKRGEGARPAALSDVPEPAESAPNDIAQCQEMLDIDAALNELETRNAEWAQIVKWKFFLGLTEVEIATQLNQPRSTIVSKYAQAQTWLFRRLAAYRESDV